LFIPGQRPIIQNLSLIQASSKYQFETILQGKSYYLFHSNDTYQITLSYAPPCSNNVNETLVLIKLGSPTHGWNHAGHQIFEISFSRMNDNELQFKMLDNKIDNIPPAFYMLFYVGCSGKPSIATVIRFDDFATEI